jgi:hypothetical protein
MAACDDDHAVANAGLVLPATLAQHLGLEAVVDQLVDLGDRPGHHRPGRPVGEQADRDGIELHLAEPAV